MGLCKTDDDGMQCSKSRLQTDGKNVYKGMKPTELECGPMSNVMVALPNVVGALCSTPQSLPDAHY